ncbi:MAG: hypothetical protein F2935_03770 [Actinobacteria bacterium]|jgi:hypothetical protein|uniref:Unannotated protein n=1 Tax=freshwater metagenome TaxID=449393 RepID=A0A6J7TVK0_9ZZZZ|nr:hypothetical protein [Actinomycetota bacterium]
MSNQTEAIADIVMKFQARDLEGIRPYIHSDFTWFDHAGTIVLQGAEIFLEAIERTWRENPNVVNTSSLCLQVGNLVSHTESFRGYTDGHIEDWVWVYEFEGDAILKMYGFLNASAL